MASAMVLGPNCRKQVNFIVLLLRLGLAVFSRLNKVSKVSIRISVRETEKLYYVLLAATEFVS